jgi:hypothetical protein
VPIPTTLLETKYAAEFATAEKRIEERRQSWRERFRLRFGYDLESDRAYNFWKEEQSERREMLNIHAVDEWLDDMRMQIQYGMRVFTTIGLVHGMWRTHTLWKSIDRNYAKLHGVGLGSIAAEHVSWSVIKGAAVGVAWGFGTLIGDNGSRIVECLVTDQVVRPQRHWQHVLGACIFAGWTGSMAAIIVNRKALKPLGHAMVAGTISITSAALGIYFGYVVYRPWQETRPSYYDESPRPWHEKEFQKVGPAGVRGRWM